MTRKLYKRFEVPRDKQAKITQIFERMYGIKQKYELAYKNHPEGMFDDTEIAEEMQMINKSISEGEQEYEEIQNMQIQTPVNELSEEDVDNFNQLLAQLKREYEELKQMTKGD
ncbi:hypothetical protein [Staphylococcus capitis]|uniref:hypothetical protein n=1 Tax=Staphylococcus capitis TaxID=29388 RepID=UPI00145A56D1|nr:hypothetical protein [Staphylococcus capitis]NML00717.1 hypothetical protein [Staphylococcus capitis]